MSIVADFENRLFWIRNTYDCFGVTADRIVEFSWREQAIALIFQLNVCQIGCRIHVFAHFSTKPSVIHGGVFVRVPNNRNFSHSFNRCNEHTKKSISVRFPLPFVRIVIRIISVCRPNSFAHRDLVVLLSIITNFFVFFIVITIIISWHLSFHTNRIPTEIVHPPLLICFFFFFFLMLFFSSNLSKKMLRVCVCMFFSLFNFDAILQ